MKLLLLPVLVAGLALLLGCLSPPVDECAGYVDIGPSASTCFSIENMGDYPEYTFYYNAVHSFPYLEPIEEGINGAYKLDLLDKFYALPNGASTYMIDGPEDLEDAIVSQHLGVPIGKSVYRITSFDIEGKQMALEKVN